MVTISEKRLVIACGGTGGHLFPGIAVAEAWTREGGDVLLLISEKQIDALATEGYEHLRFEKMPSIAMPGLFSLKMPGFLFSFVRSLGACRRLLKKFRADAVLGMGGFTSAAPLAAGRMAGLPTFIHESNSIPGKANRLNARFARSVLVGFASCGPLFGTSRRVEVVGTPLRPSLVNRPTREESLARFGLDPGKKTVMVMGGSQGARRVNELVAASLSSLAEAGLQMLHISGPSDYELVKPAYDALPAAGVLRDFCSEIQYAYAAADLAVCRSGASTLTELGYYEIPSVLIPYPFSAEDHQTSNARIFSDPGAAVLWPQGELNEKNFSDKIIELIHDEEQLEKMRASAARLAVPDASARVCEVIAASLA
ncbi:MAG: undecaprenyldiphospho-muramoylpentapeptide beta-N-acetylglucosaminyltransferase [Verrucomicrobiaceae bacterium]|nr:undecaprenyldiphospho-muramoylpentapeptide beta-N-acetylglucosaminyltransferase [Verrucomicrobiaceae bacterium]